MFKKYNRLFTFGCSFTKYFWPTWAEVLAYDLDIPFYNYGCIGAGNQYISNMIVQADQFYKFNKDDLIVVCWTNVCREDKWVDGHWVTPGNIFTQNAYDSAYVKKFADPTGYLIRDLATIKLTKRLLDYTQCDYHFLTMADLRFWLSQYEKNTILEKQREIINLYSDIFDTCRDSFYKILYNDDITQLIGYYNSIFNNKFTDYHPLPIQHFKYLTTVFNQYNFKQSTVDKVNLSNDAVITYVNDTPHNTVHNFTDFHKRELYDISTIKLSNAITYY